MKWFRKKKNSVEEKTAMVKAPVKEDPHRLAKLASGKFTAYCLVRESRLSYSLRGTMITFDPSDIVYVDDDHNVIQAKRRIIEKSSVDPMADKADVIEYTGEYVHTWAWAERVSDSNSYDYCSNGYITKYISPKVVVSEKVVDTPLDAFRREGKFFLITDEEEFKKYLNSSMDIQTWCYNKIYDAFRAYGLDPKWITENAVRIHNDLEKYNKALALMEELKYERDSISRFMYLFTCTFV